MLAIYALTDDSRHHVGLCANIIIVVMLLLRSIKHPNQ